MAPAKVWHSAWWCWLQPQSCLISRLHAEGLFHASGALCFSVAILVPRCHPGFSLKCCHHPAVPTKHCQQPLLSLHSHPSYPDCLQQKERNCVAPLLPSSFLPAVISVLKQNPSVLQTNKACGIQNVSECGHTFLYSHFGDTGLSKSFQCMLHERWLCLTPR